MVGVASSGAAPVRAGFARGIYPSGGGCAQVRRSSGLAFQGRNGPGRRGEGFPAVAAAFVEVGGEPGQDVEAGHLDGGGDGPDHGGEAGGVPVTGAACVLPSPRGRGSCRSAGLLSSLTSG